MKKVLIATLLALSGVSVQAANYYVVVPVTKKQPAISVALQADNLPQAEAQLPYPGFDFKNLLQVTGDVGFDPGLATWSMVSGALPAGIALDSGSGTLAGTPSTAGTYDFSVKAIYKTKTAQQSYQLVTAPHLYLTLSGSLPSTKLGQAYAYDLKAGLSVNGDSTYAGDGTGVTWRITSGSLPTGLSLSDTGLISGTPTQYGSYPLTVEASYKGRTVTQAFSLTVQNADPYWANVVLLLHFDGNLTDSAKGKSVTNTNTQASGAAAKFGSGSRYFPGTTANNLLYAGNGDFNFGTGNFTVEGWFYKLDAPTVTNNDRAMFSGQWGSWSPTTWWVGGYANNGAVRGGVMGGFYGAGGLTESNLMLNQWVHYAWVREGTQLRMYRNGVNIASTSIGATTALGNNNGLFIGRVADNVSFPGFYGYMDEIRVSKGIARYSANFTPPTEAFPNQ